MFALVGLDKDLLDSLGASVVAIFDLNVTGSICGVPIIGGDELWPEYSAANPAVRPILAIDPPLLRAQLAEHYGRDLVAGFVSEHAYVSARATLARGIVVQRHAYVSADVALGEGVRINVGAQIHHDCRIGSFATIAPAAALMGSVVVGENAYIGANATILQGISIGEGATVGAGAVVTRPVAPGRTVVGVPAK